jgi:hypothetical protein
MNNPIQSEAEMKTLKHQTSFIVPPKAETNEGTSMFIKDQDTMLSMTVLLLACLALAVLAHVFV